ncbi:MAG: zinc-dependent alcohol dehydrogenase [Anaerolineae bacterium]
MKALQLQGLGQVALVEAPRPKVAPDEVLVKTGASTICTSDLNDIRENPFGIEFPVILGHEAAGTVIEVGSQVQDLKRGDRVATSPVAPCGTCANCRRSWPHLCLNVSHFGIDLQGTFAEYFPVRVDRARAISDEVPLTVAALAEPVSVCLEALSQAQLPEGGKLLIIGDGPFGVLMARMAAQHPLEKVVIAGWEDFRLSFATGAVQVNTFRMRDPQPPLRAEAGATGYDAVILAVSSAEAVRDGVALLRAKGRFVVFSALPGETPVDLFDVHVRELEIVGACNEQDRFYEAVDMLGDPELQLGDLVTHTFPLERYDEALVLAEHGHDRALKVAFTFEGES